MNSARTHTLTINISINRWLVSFRSFLFPFDSCKLGPNLFYPYHKFQSDFSFNKLSHHPRADANGWRESREEREIEYNVLLLLEQRQQQLNASFALHSKVDANCLFIKRACKRSEWAALLAIPNKNQI